MYFCELEIAVVAQNDGDMIEKSARATRLPEDCGVSVTRFDSPDAFFAAKHLPDCTVIADGTQTGFDPQDTRLSDVVCALLVEAAEINEVEEYAFKFEELLVMQCGDRYNPDLLGYYLERLVFRMKALSDSRKLSICLNTAIDSLDDLVWFKDTKGAHLSVNNSFCQVTGKTKQQIYKRGHYYIWDISVEEYQKGEYVCLESEDIVMQARETRVFDEQLKTKTGMRQLKTFKSPLIDVDGNIFGTCGIAHDVTDLHNINSELRVILESMPFAVLIEDDKGVILSTNKHFSELFGDSARLIGKNYYDWKREELSGKILSFNEREEICIKVGGAEKYLNYGEEPILDIFGERIGSIGIFRDVTDERISEKQTIKSANTDFLTGLNNRRALFGYLNKLKKTQQLTFISLDLDNFKQVNDVSGHHMGDVALELTSHIMQQSFPDDFIARLGGDEFLIVIKRPCFLHDVQNDTEQLLASLKDQYLDHVEFASLSASAGIASEKLALCGSYDFDRLLRHSDRALYAAKKAGKGICCVYQGEEDTDTKN